MHNKTLSFIMNRQQIKTTVLARQNLQSLRYAGTMANINFTAANYFVNAWSHSLLLPIMYTSNINYQQGLHFKYACLISFVL
jgi:hypothetical protein